MAQPAARDLDSDEWHFCGLAETSAPAVAKVLVVVSDVPVAARVPAAGVELQQQRLRLITSNDKAMEGDKMGESVEIKKGDEDVGWLFEEVETASRQPKVLKGSGKQRHAMNTGKGRRKLPDIDLDDLISDINAYAEIEVGATARSAGVSTHVGHATARRPKARRKM
jgi:hypothetical protein